MSKGSSNPQFLVGLLVLAFVLLTGCQQTPTPTSSEGIPSQDLVFSPAEIAVAPGSENSVEVSVTSEADLTTATFALEQPAKGIRVNFEPSDEGTSGDLSIEAEGTLGESTHTLTVKGTDGVHTWLGTLNLTVTPTAAKTFRVNPATGSDNNPGTLEKPFGTLFHALQVVHSGDTIRLADGFYSDNPFSANNANIETFTHADPRGAPPTLVFVPSGVSIIGQSRNVVLTSNFPDATALNLAGSATIKNLKLRNFRTGIFALAGEQTLRNLNIEQTAKGLELKGTAVATLGNSVISLTALPNVTSVAGVEASDNATFLMDGGNINGVSRNCDRFGTGISLHNLAKATLQNKARLEQIPGVAISLRDSAKATLLTDSTINRVNLSTCAPSSGIVVFDSGSLTVDHGILTSAGGSGAIGIFTTSTAPVTLNGAFLSGYTGSGVRGFTSLNLTSSNSFFNQNATAISAPNVASPSITLEGDTIAEGGIGLETSKAKVRNAVIRDNQQGIVITKTGLDVNLDLGTATQAGNNFFVRNALTSIAFSSSAQQNPQATTINASGNTWNANVQSADANGKYVKGSRVNGSNSSAHGSNFDMPSPVTSIVF